jgi:hypothetical protein
MNKKAFKQFVLISFIALFLFLVSCNKDNPGQNPDSGGAANPAKLTATVSKNYTVLLSWTALEGTLTLERKLKDDTEFTALADVTGKMSFEDVPVLDTLSYSYRLKSEAGSSETTIAIPAVSANPLTVAITGDSTKSVTQSIGPTGGTMTATGADGTTYTLTMPENALLSEREITLTPVSSIDNLPLSGGLLGAVQISPEIEFYNYATLSIQPASAAPANATVVSFAAENTGVEFYLLATAKTATTTLQAQQDDAPLPTLRLDRAGTYGAGAGTTEDVRGQVQNHPPTSPSSQTQQASFVDDVPLPTIPPREVFIAGDRERRIRNELSTGQGSLQDVFREYRQWLEYLRQNELEAGFLDRIKTLSKEMANKIGERFDELYQKCEQDPSVTKEMQSLVNWAQNYPALVQNLGQAWFSEARDRIKLCQPGTWQGNFTATVSNAAGAYTFTITDLIWTYEGQGETGTLRYLPTSASVDVQLNVQGCTANITNEALIDEGNNFLEINYQTVPATYVFAFDVRFSSEVICEGISLGVQTATQGFGGLNDLNPVLSNNNTEIMGSRTFTTGSGAATAKASGTYTFRKISE